MACCRSLDTCLHCGAQTRQEIPLWVSVKIWYALIRQYLKLLGLLKFINSLSLSPVMAMCGPRSLWGHGGSTSPALGPVLETALTQALWDEMLLKPWPQWKSFMTSGNYGFFGSSSFGKPQISSRFVFRKLPVIELPRCQKRPLNWEKHVSGKAKVE